MRSWLAAVPGQVWAALSVTSLALFLVSALLMPWLLVRLPADALLRPRLTLWERLTRASPVGVALVLLRNLLGLMLFLAGVAMLFLPGQGLLTMAAGVALLDVPLRHRLLVWILHRHSVGRMVDCLRARAGVAPLERPRPPAPPMG